MRVCEAEGAHISIVNSEKEADYFMQLMAKFSDDFILMGFHDAFIKDEYLTMDGKNHNDFNYYLDP